MRTFAAIELERPAIRALEAATAQLREHPAAPRGLRWLPAASWHLTLQFFGEVEAQAVPQLAAACDAAVRDRPAFDLALSGLGAFPTPRRARVVWLGVERGAAELEALARALWQCTAPLGFVPEARPFRPHLTLARCRKPAAVATLLQDARVASMTTRVGGLALFRSHLSQEGARYERLHLAELGT